ncbi:hypothetical protein ACJX0J_034242 [Zea mays]
MYADAQKKKKITLNDKSVNIYIYKILDQSKNHLDPGKKEKNIDRKKNDLNVFINLFIRAMDQNKSNETYQLYFTKIKKMKIHVKRGTPNPMPNAMPVWRLFEIFPLYPNILTTREFG